MKKAVRYYTRSGNTKKLAEAIAAALGEEALDLTVPLAEKVDLLFLGNSPYGFRPDPAVGQFLTENASMIGAIANFGSSASLRSTMKTIQSIAEQNSIALLKEEFICPGSFLFLHKGHPDETDLENAAAFAKKAAGV